jgi:4a-hydroxytetrahydrobiopterin dehydratase
MRTPATIRRMPDAPEHWIEKVDALVREVELADFAGALAYVNEVAKVAEAANHHPDILIHGYNKVRLTLTTHDAGGLTDADYDMAASINSIRSDA